MKSDGSAQVNGSRYSATLLSPVIDVEKVPNYDFSGGTTGWIFSGGSVTGGVFTSSATLAYKELIVSGSLDLEYGAWYEIKIKITALTGNLKFTLGRIASADKSSDIIASPGGYTHRIIHSNPLATHTITVFSWSLGATVSIDYISIKKITPLMSANTESKIIIPYEPGEMKLIHGANETVTDFSGTFGPVTTFGIGPGTSHMTHKSLKIFKRPRVTLDGMTTVYSDTVSGMLISAVAGTAFFDLLPAEVLALADGNHLIEVTDAAGKKLVAVMAAVGTGETLGSELSSDPLFANNASWTKEVAQWSVSGNTAIANVVTNTKRIYQLITTTQYGLYKTVMNCSAYTAGGFKWAMFGNAAWGPSTAYNSSGAKTLYSTKSATTGQNTFGIAGSGADLTAVFNSISAKQVLTPSASGITLVSYLGSSTQSLMYADPAFDYNQAAAYGVTVKEME